MAFAGLKKQINKANQYVTEKMGGAEGTKLDEDFTEMEKKIDITVELVEDLQLKTKEYLQPNPNARAKMAAVKGISKLSGQAKAATYPQPEGVLGECMLTFGRRLSEDTSMNDSMNIAGQAMVEFGESLKQMADVKYSLDDNVKQNFLEPLHHLQTKDLKEVMHHRKKLQGRRLDFDCKKRRKDKGSHVTEEEMKLAEDKFAESLHLAQMGMHNLLENDVTVEQISQLASLAEALLEYHRQCSDILQTLTEKLLDKKNEAASRPRREFTPKSLGDLAVPTYDSGSVTPQRSPYHSPQHSPVNSPTKSSQHPTSLFSDNFGNTTGPAKFSVIPAPRAVNPSPWIVLPPDKSASNASPLPSPMKSPSHRGPCSTALYDFDPENPNEIGFKEGDTIQLLSRVDDNWFEGTVNGKTGLFPVSYVQVIVPLP